MIQNKINNLQSRIAELDEIKNNFIQNLIKKCSGKKVLLLTTSTRWLPKESAPDLETPKSTQLAQKIAKEISGTLINVPELLLYPCEGNISKTNGNNCGVKEALLKDKTKNPSGYHRCWASINNKDDELWKITKPLFESDIILFFTSARWGQTNSVFQKLIERLSWIENRNSTLEENPIPKIKKQEVGLIIFGHNWLVEEILDREKKVFEFFGWNTPNDLSFFWQYTNADDESQKSYTEAPKAIEKNLNFDLEIKKNKPTGL